MFKVFLTPQPLNLQGHRRRRRRRRKPTLMTNHLPKLFSQFRVVQTRAMLFFWLAIVSILTKEYATGCTVSSGSDVGSKLMLTPYIESGKIDEAKKLAFVPPLKGNVKSYSGFLTVDKKCDSNLFFWFFLAETSPEKSPVTLWLSGGPGESLFHSLFLQHGPYELTPSNNLTLRKYSWTRVTNMIYIDNPVGTGYSYTKGCYSKSAEEVATNLLKAVKQIFKMFPELRSNPFFITGESYAGKFTPALGYAILKDTDTENKINLQGLSIGVGYVDPMTQLELSQNLYQIGFFDDNARERGITYQERCKALIADQKWREAYNCTMSFVGFIENTTQFRFAFNYLYNRFPPQGNFTEFGTRNEIRKSLHVGNATWSNATKVQENLLPEDHPKSSAHWLPDLLDHYRVLVYNGQLDLLMPYTLTVAYLRKLKWSGANEYKSAPRWVWRVDDDIAGYSKTTRNLTEVLVRNAGHILPMDQPKWAFDLISRFVQNKPFHTQ